MLGKLTGRLLHLQKMSNHLGWIARQKLMKARPEDPNRASEGFQACALLFCAAPLGVLGAVQDGLTGYFYPLAVKGVMDGLAAFGLVAVFGWPVILAAVPVLALEGTITLLCGRWVAPWLETQRLLDSVNCMGG